MLRSGILAAVLGLLLVSSPAMSSPCTSNSWQPTFVHDLDTDDTPFYVTSGMTFVPLQWQPNGGYVPHACALVRGPQDLRDTRGFTTCQDYTRVQCGCSRSIPGNSTCAAFLRWHNPPPGPAASGPAAGPWVAPGIGPAPPMSPSVAPAIVAVPLNGWRQAAQYAGGLQGSSLGLVLQGGAWTNGQLRGGAYDGNRVVSAQVFDFSRGGDAYMKLLANGAGQYMGFWPRVLEGVSVLHMTTHHSWANSVVVPDNAWVYAHLRVEPDGAYRIAVAAGNYDDRGGQVIYRNAGRLANPRGRLELQFADNYAGQAASMVIGEAVVKTGGGGVSAFPPARSGGQARPAGGACSTSADCASSVCLLGVCAPR
jgi:hypothetical protein